MNIFGEGKVFGETPNTATGMGRAPQSDCILPAEPFFAPVNRRAAVLAALRGSWGQDRSTEYSWLRRVSKAD